MLGAAVGDALGFPFEGASRSFVMAIGSDVITQYERHRSGYFPEGQYSDDTQLSLATIEGIVEAGGVDGATLASRYAALWRENVIIGRSEPCTEAVNRLLDGMSWTESGLGRGRTDNGAAMRAAPIGLWDYDQPARLLEDIDVASRITHRDVRAIAGAAVVAAAVAYNLTHREVILGEFIDSVAATAAHFDPEFGRTLQNLPHYLSMGGDQALEVFAELAGENPLTSDGVGPDVTPTVLVALYYFLRSPASYLETVRNCLLAGGDVDTTAAIAGALSGSFNGLDAIPKSLQEGVLHRERMLRQADRLHAMKEEERSRGS